MHVKGGQLIPRQSILPRAENAYYIGVTVVRQSKFFKVFTSCQSEVFYFRYRFREGYFFQITQIRESVRKDLSISRRNVDIFYLRPVFFAERVENPIEDSLYVGFVRITASRRQPYSSVVVVDIFLYVGCFLSFIPLIAQPPRYVEEYVK